MTGKVSRAEVGYGLAWHGKAGMAGQRGVRYCAVSFGAVRQGTARQAWRVMIRSGTERFVRIRIGMAGKVGSGEASQGMVGSGRASYGRHGKDGFGRRVGVCRGMFRRGKAVKVRSGWH